MFSDSKNNTDAVIHSECTLSKHAFLSVYIDSDIGALMSSWSFVIDTFVSSLSAVTFKMKIGYHNSANGI